MTNKITAKWNDWDPSEKGAFILCSSYLLWFTCSIASPIALNKVSDLTGISVSATPLQKVITSNEGISKFSGWISNTFTRENSR